MLDQALAAIHSARSDYVLYGAAALFVLGILLGLAKKITVYSSYSDVFRCFAALASAAAALYFLSDMADSPLWMFAAGLSVILLIWIAYRTWQDNPNPLAAVLAFFVKVPVGALFVLLLLDVIAPAGSGADRRYTKQRSLLDFLLITVVIRALIVPRESGDDVMPMRLGARLPR